MVYRGFGTDNHAPLTIKHIGDSRVYYFDSQTEVWQCVTRDHNLLNHMVDEKAESEHRQAKFCEYNQAGMASHYYSLLEHLTVDSDSESNPMPRYETGQLSVKSGDAIVVCSDGVHDLVPCDAWQGVYNTTDLQDWLKNLRKQIYESDGKAYDNATAILITFNE